MGESCGGVSATLLLHSNEPLFSRVISMGGHALLMAPIPLETANEAYAKVVDCLGLRDLSPAQRVEKLRTIPHKDIIDKVPSNIPNRPVIDSALFQRALTAQDVENATDTESIPGKTWCQDLLIGDCQADVSAI
jgi:carboxylesterase type B